MKLPGYARAVIHERKMRESFHGRLNGNQLQPPCPDQTTIAVERVGRTEIFGCSVRRCEFEASAVESLLKYFSVRPAH